jgi:hypothetical protein
VKANEVRRLRGESGASLILAIAFLLVVGGISGAVLSATTSGLKDRAALDAARNREYAADAGIEQSINRVRSLPAPVTNCATGATGATFDVWPVFDGVTIRVECAGDPTPILDAQGNIVLQNNVIFTACVSTGQPCTDTNATIRAEINFQSTGAPRVASITSVLAWSVNS